MALLLIPSATAQQTIFNVPNAEVTEKNEVYLQHQSNFRPWKPGRYYETNNNAAYGIGYNTELDVTLFNVEAPRTENLAIGVGDQPHFLVPVESRGLGSYHSPQDIAGIRRIPASGGFGRCQIA